MEATIVNVQKYSVHDGPGIRTTIFFKGCPLKCWWCHNPESLNPSEEIVQCAEKCTGCGRCVARCSEDAIHIKNGDPFIELEKCKLCGKCADLCISEAREHIGKVVSVRDIMDKIKKDIVFYEESGGGVTFSGGEPLMHSEFLNETLKRCKLLGINTTVDTCGYAPWERFEKIHDKVDLFLYDLKIFNDEKHIKYTGVSNAVILENLKRLSDLGKNIYIRMPIIRGINDDDEHIDKSLEFISTLNIKQVNILPYHRFGMDKYQKLRMSYKLNGDEKPLDKTIDKIVKKFRNRNIKVEVGG